MLSLRHNFLQRSLAALAYILVAANATGDPLSDKLEAECKKVYSGARPLQSAWAQVLRGLPRNSVGVLDLTLEGVVADSKVRILGTHARDGSWMTFEVWLPRSGMKCSFPEHKKLACTWGGALKGSIDIELPASFLLLGNKPKRVTFNVSGKPGKATWRASITKGTKKATVKWSDVSGSFKLPSDYPAVPKKYPTVFDAYADAVAGELLACNHYRTVLYAEEIRLGRKNAIPPYPAPERPTFASRQAGSAGPTPGAAAPGLDDLDLDDGLGLDDLDGPAESTQKKKEDLTKHPDAKDRLKQLTSMSDHIKEMSAWVSSYVSGKKAEPVKAEFPRLDDSLFGPWWRMSSLTVNRKKGNVLPAHKPNSPQSWQYVDNWKVLGPLDEGAEAVRSGFMPSRLNVDGLVYRVPSNELARAYFKNAMPSTFDYEKEGVVKWRPWFADEVTGILRPPDWYTYRGVGYSKVNCGQPDSSWYGAADIDCPQAGEYWVACGVDDDGQLWINNSLVAAWPDLKKRADLESPIMFRYAFKKGKNPVLIRVRQDSVRNGKIKDASGFWMRICTAGKPLDKAAAAARDAKLAALPRLDPISNNIKGWRDNWKGKPRHATEPPTAWSYWKKKNILWDTPLPLSMATPIVAGGLVITTATPYHIVALDKMTGEIRWRGSLSVLEILAPELAKEAEALYDEKYAILKECSKLENIWDRDATITVNGNTQKVSDHNSAISKRMREFSRKEKAATEKGEHVTGYLWGNYMGPNPATPVTDGKHVWAWSCQGGAACYDLQGKRRWIVQLPHRGTSYGAFSSPILLDSDNDGAADVLIIEVVPVDVKKALEVRPVVMLALDAKTGKELWRAPVHEPAGAASPVAMRVTNGKEKMTVLITAGGGGSEVVDHDGTLMTDFSKAKKAGRLSAVARDKKRYNSIWGGTIVRGADGKVLIPNMSVATGYGTPVVDGNVVYHFSPNMQTATQIIMVDRNTLGTKRLWTRWYTAGFEPNVIIQGDYIYALLASEIHGGQRYRGYAVFDKHTGEMLPRSVNVGWHLFPHFDYYHWNSRCYPPSSLVNGFLYHADTGEGFGGKNRNHAGVDVLQAKPNGRIIAQNNTAERMDAALGFDGDRIYARSTGNMCCIGYTGDGKAYEARENARLLMEDYPKYKPTTVDAVPVEPRHNYPVKIVPCADFFKRPNANFYHPDPSAKDISAEVIAFWGKDAKFSWKYRSLVSRIGAKTMEFQKRGGVFDQASGNTRRGDCHNGYHGSVLSMQTICFEKCMPRAGWDYAKNPAVYFYAYRIDRFRKPQTLRFIVDNPELKMRMWLNGVPLKHNARYAIKPGDYGMLIEAQFTKPFSKKNGDEVERQYLVDTYFVRSADDPTDDVKAYEEDIASIRPYLEKVIKLAPDSPEAKRAKAIMAR